MARVEIWKDDKLILRQGLDPAGRNAGWSIRIAPHARVRLRVGESADLGEYEVRVLESGPDSPEPAELKPASHDGGLAELDVRPCEDDGSGGLPDGPSRTQTAHGPATQADLAAKAQTAASLPGPLSSPSPKQRIGASTANGASDAPPEIEGYRVIEKIGEGGMGTVWKAEQLGTRREVAVKLMGTHMLGSQKARARFEREVELASRLKHPNIARIHDSGLHRGVYYCAMELIDGLPLDEYVREKKLTQRQILELMAKVSQAVQHAHQRGVIHRDLKPSNILASDDGQPHVVDFGLAKSFLAGDHGMGVTLTGDLAGTPLYMSPEQAAGHVDDIDIRTDVYALGVILYQLLVGKHPHGLTPGLGIREVLLRITDQEVVPPRRVTRRIGKELEALLLKALARKPDGRYTFAGDLADDIHDYLSGEPLAARVPTTVYFLRKRLRKYRLQVSIAAAVLAALMGMAVFAYVRVRFERNRLDAQYRRAEAERQRAEKERGSALTAKAVAENARKETEREAYARAIAFAERKIKEANIAQAEDLLNACPAAQRCWEWGRLERLCHLDIVTLRGHTGGISSIAFSPDGKRIASGSNDNTVKIWGARRAREVLTLRHPSEVNSVAFSPDGKRIASGSGAAVKIWDAASGREVMTLKGHASKVNSVAFSPDGKRIASGGWDNTVRIWDAANGQQVMTLKAEMAVIVYSVAFSPDGKRIASGSDGNTIRIWDVTGGQEVITLRGHARGINSVAFSRDGKRIVSGSWDNTVRIWDARSGQEVMTLTGHTRPVFSVAFSADGKRIASGSWDNTLKIWDARSGREVMTLKGHVSGVHSVAFSPDGKHLASGSSDNALKIWDAVSHREIMTLKGHTSSVRSIAFSHDGKRIASGSWEHPVKIWDATSGQEIMTLKGHARGINSVSFSPDPGLFTGSAVFCDLRPVPPRRYG